MTIWTHPICLRCWIGLHPGWVPARVLNDDEEQCCFCGAKTSDGIYVRADQDKLKFCACTEG